MDVQMPEMDGLEATAALRRAGEEQRSASAGGRDDGTGHERRPGALPGRRAWTAICPSRFGRRNSTTFWTAIWRGCRGSAARACNPGSGRKCERAGTAGACGRRPRVLAELAEVFREDYPKQMNTAREAAASGDAEKVQRAGHALKGALSNLAATQACAVAVSLEAMGKAGDLSGAALCWRSSRTSCIEWTESCSPFVRSWSNEDPGSR